MLENRENNKKAVIIRTKISQIVVIFQDLANCCNIPVGKKPKEYRQFCQ